MSFYSFLQTGGHSIPFSISSMDVQYFIFCSQEYLNWLTTDILQLLSVMQILTEWDVATGIISWGFTPALSISVETFWTQPGFRPLPCDYLEDDILSGPSSVVNMGEWLQDTGQFLPVSTLSAARRLLGCRDCFIFPLSAVTERTHTLHIHVSFCHTCSSCLQLKQQFISSW